jgi:hypothetical protein
VTVEQLWEQEKLKLSEGERKKFVSMDKIMGFVGLKVRYYTSASFLALVWLCLNVCA